MSFLWHERDSALRVFSMYPVSQWLWFKPPLCKWSPFQTDVASPLKGGSEVRPAEGHPSLTSLLISVPYSAKHAQLCVKEIHEVSVSTWLFFFFFLFSPLSRPYTSTAHTSSRLYQTCVSPTLDVWKELTVFALTNDVSTCVSGRGNINCLNLILVHPGQAVMDLLALISFSPPIICAHI